MPRRRVTSRLDVERRQGVTFLRNLFFNNNYIF
jgi:hypothetical protein